MKKISGGGGRGNNTERRASGTIQWGEKGGLPDYTETNSVILGRVRGESSIVERVSKNKLAS